MKTLYKNLFTFVALIAMSNRVFPAAIDCKIPSEGKPSEGKSSQILNKSHFRGISIYLYRVMKAERFEELHDLDSQMVKSADTRMNLNEMSADISMIFGNTIDPFTNKEAIGYKIGYGKHAQKIPFDGVGGFLPFSEVVKISKWFKKNKVNTYRGFSKIYDRLSPEVKKELTSWLTPDKASIFKTCIKPLTEFYFLAVKNENSIVFFGS